MNTNTLERPASPVPAMHELIARLENDPPCARPQMRREFDKYERVYDLVANNAGGNTFRDNLDLASAKLYIIENPFDAIALLDDDARGHIVKEFIGDYDEEKREYEVVAEGAVIETPVYSKTRYFFVPPCVLDALLRMRAVEEDTAKFKVEGRTLRWEYTLASMWRTKRDEVKASELVVGDEITYVNAREEYVKARIRSVDARVALPYLDVQSDEYTGALHPSAVRTRNGATIRVSFEI